MDHMLVAGTCLGPTIGPWWSELAHCADSEPPKQLAKCLSMLHTADG